MLKQGVIVKTGNWRGRKNGNVALEYQWNLGLGG